MPAGFDVTKLDTGLSPDDLGEVVAGTPAEMEQAVLEAVGLPYEQFTSCVVLPQGQFADFLHAKPATRQQILVNLLGLGVYEEVQKKATARAAQAEAAAGRGRPGARRVDRRGRRGVGRGRRPGGAGWPSWPPTWPRRCRSCGRPGTTATGGRGGADAAGRRAARADRGARAGRGDRLSLARSPTARAEAEAAATAVSLAEEREEKLRGELAAAGDATALRLLLQAYDDRERLAGEADTAAGAPAARGERRARRGGGGPRPPHARRRAGRRRAGGGLRAHEEAKATDLAVSAAGAPARRCAVPGVRPAGGRGAGGACRIRRWPPRRRRARPRGPRPRPRSRRCSERDTAARELERRSCRREPGRSSWTARLAELDGQLAGAAEPAALRQELAEHARLRRAIWRGGDGGPGRPRDALGRPGPVRTRPRSGCGRRGGPSTPPGTGWPGSAHRPPTATTWPPRGRR